MAGFNLPPRSGPRTLPVEAWVSVATWLTPPVSNVEFLDNVWDEAILALSAESRVPTIVHFHLA